MITKAITQHGSLDRKDIDELLWNKLSDVLNEKQKKDKVTNLLAELRKKNEITNEGTFKYSKWVLIKTKQEG